MACFENVRIKQTVTYNSTPDTTNGLLQGQVLVEIFNTYGYPILGEITIDKIRELPVISLEDDAISETQAITSTGDTFNFNFYYSSNEPVNIVIGAKVKIRVEDCFYEHSCSHVLLTPNPDEDFSYCDIFVQGYDVISGCTDSAYYEYNFNANVDDGSCLTLKPVYGCTNSLALTYNPLATFNDGSCVFKSGCTNPIAANYNSEAIIDDGSCECGDVNIKLDFDLASGESYVIEADCRYLLEFDLIAEINCEKLVDYLVNDTRTILEVLETLNINAQTYVLTDDEGKILDYTGGTLSYTGDTGALLIQSENLYTFDRNIVPYGIGLYGNAEDCDFVNQLISAELGIDCPTAEELSNRFKTSWKRYSYVLNSDLIDTFTRNVLNFANFDFGLCCYIDNVKLSKICEVSQDRCVIIPSKYGFELDKVVDNRKSWVYSEEKNDRFYDFDHQETDYVDYESKLSLNTKELELTINPVKYIEKDVLDYYSFYSKFFTSIDERYTELTKDKILYESIDPIGRQFIRQYPYLSAIYEQYLDGLDCAPTKALDYPYGLEIISKTGDYWYSAVKQLLPATAIWNEAQFTIKNNAFHKPKYAYRKYSLGGVSDTDIESPSGVTISCVKLSDKCASEEFSSLDELLDSSFGNVECTSIYSGGTFGYSGGSGDGYFSGRLVQYSVNENGENVIEDYIGFDDYICITGEPIPTGTTCESVVILPNLSYECITVEGINTGFATVTITPTGGQAPYSVVNAFDLDGGVIIAEGDSFSYEEEDGDVIQLIVTDVNGCVAEPELCTITIDCPIDEDNCTPVTCGDNEFQLEASLTNYTGLFGFYEFAINLTSPSYIGVLTGSYKISDLKRASILSGFEKYYDNAIYTPDVALSNTTEFGFNQLTPNQDATTAGATDSPWLIRIVNDIQLTNDNPAFIVGNNITIDIALFDSDYCVHKTSVTLTIPTDNNTNTVISPLF